MYASTRSHTAEPSAPTPSTVFVVAPGGLHDRAGIGRLMTGVSRCWPTIRTHWRLRIIDPYGPAVLPIAPFFFARALLQIVWNAWRSRIGLLHVHMARGGSVLRKGIIVHLGARLGLPVILHLHGPDLEMLHRRLPPLGQRLLTRTLVRAQRVVVLGDYWRRVTIDQFGVDAARVVVLPNGIAAPADVPAKRAPRSCRILFLGRIDPEKGLPELLDALADQRLAGLEWSVRIAGGGAVHSFEKQAVALGLGERVEFTGWVEEAQVRRWLAEADVFVLPSHHEGLSMALLEAMAFGLAIVVTPVGATPDAIVDGVSGLLVPVGDAPALATALYRVIADTALRAALQAAARQTFGARFDIAAHCRALSALYDEVHAAASVRPVC